MTFLVSDITYLKKYAIKSHNKNSSYAIKSRKKPDLHVLKIGKFSGPTVLSRPKYFGRQCDINDIQL
jgi:hypothetical protein